MWLKPVNQNQASAYEAGPGNREGIILSAAFLVPREFKIFREPPQGAFSWLNYAFDQKVGLVVIRASEISNRADAPKLSDCKKDLSNNVASPSI